MAPSMIGKQLDAKEADGVKALLAQERAAILDKCTQCGRCFEVCPMVPYDAALAAHPPRAVVAGIIDILQERPGSQPALRWTQMCTKSGVCDEHCPEHISPKMMLRLARIIALGGMGHAAQLPVKEDPDYFNKVHAFGRLQLTDAERAEWMVAPRRAR
ncbi:MAG: 4Fe-4S dicluster domain-containing protein [Burkholderiales bacterium]